MRSFILFLGLLLLPANADAANTTDIQLGCTPWDGQSLELKISTADNSYHIALAGKGLIALRQGVKTITVDNAGQLDHNAIGQARICSSVVPSDMPCHNANLTLVFEDVQVDKGGHVSGHIEWNDMKVPFSGIVQSGGQPCG